MMTDKKFAPLTRITELREGWSNEASDFTPWLADNIQWLSDVIGLDELDNIRQEETVGSYSADIVATEVGTENIVVIENQLTQTDHDHLGKMLTYASGLKAKTVIWITKQFTAEHIAVMDWLNENTTNDLSFFGIEVELWRIEDSRLAPRLNVVSKPNDWTRRFASSKVIETDLQKTQLRFWQKFHESLRNREPSFSFKNVTPKGQNWMFYSMGRSGFVLRTIVVFRDHYVKTAVNIRSHSGHPQAFFHLLKNFQDEIAENLQFDLTWTLGRKEAVIEAKADFNLEDEAQWNSAHEWLADKANRLYQEFAPRIQELDADDYEE